MFHVLPFDISHVVQYSNGSLRTSTEQLRPIDEYIAKLNSGKMEGTLTLNNKNVNNADIKKLVECLERNASNNITCLNLTDNCIDDQGMIYIARLLRNNCKIKRVFLARNHFTTIGFSTLRDALQTNYVVIVCDLSGCDNTITAILERNHLLESYGTEMVVAIHTNAAELRKLGFPKGLAEIVLSYAISDVSLELTNKVVQYIIKPVLERMYPKPVVQTEEPTTSIHIAPCDKSGADKNERENLSLTLALGSGQSDTSERPQITLLYQHQTGTGTKTSKGNTKEPKDAAVKATSKSKQSQLCLQVPKCNIL